MGLEPVRVPDALHAGMADANLLSHPPGKRPIADAIKLKIIEKTVKERPANATHWRSLDQAGDTSLDKVVLPAPNGRLRYPDRAHDYHHANLKTAKTLGLTLIDECIEQELFSHVLEEVWGPLAALSPAQASSAHNSGRSAAQAEIASIGADCTVLWPMLM